MTTRLDGRTKHASPVQETQAQVHAALAVSRKRESARQGLSHLEPMPERMCGATWDNNDYCTRREGHGGECNCRRAGERGEDEEGGYL